MSELVYIYVDNNQVIQEIEFSSTNKFDQYKLTAITKSMAGEIIELHSAWEQNPRSKNKKNILVQINDQYYAKKAMYVYYHFKDKSINSITPRPQEALDDNADLRRGLMAVDGILEGCIEGTKSMINYRVNTDGDVLLLEELPAVTESFDFFGGVLLITDYEVIEVNEDAVIYIIYNGREIIIKRTDDSVIDKKYELFFMNKFDKTVFYDSVSFVFTKDQDEIRVPAIFDDKCMVISMYRNIMSFKEM